MRFSAPTGVLSCKGRALVPDTTHTAPLRWVAGIRLDEAAPASASATTGAPLMARRIMAMIDPAPGANHPPPLHRTIWIETNGVKYVGGGMPPKPPTSPSMATPLTSAIASYLPGGRADPMPPSQRPVPPTTAMFCDWPGANMGAYAVPAIAPVKTPTTRLVPGFVMTTSIGWSVKTVTLCMVLGLWKVTWPRKSAPTWITRERRSRAEE